MVLKDLLHRWKLQLLIPYSFNDCMIHFPEQVQRLRESAFKYCAYPRFLRRISSVIIHYFTEADAVKVAHSLYKTSSEVLVCLMMQYFKLFGWISLLQHAYTQTISPWCDEQKDSYYRKIQKQVYNRIVQKLKEVAHHAWVVLMPWRQWIIFHVIRLKGNTQQMRQIQNVAGSEFSKQQKFLIAYIFQLLLHFLLWFFFFFQFSEYSDKVIC